MMAAICFLRGHDWHTIRCSLGVPGLIQELAGCERCGRVRYRGPLTAEVEARAKRGEYHRGGIVSEEEAARIVRKIELGGRVDA